MEISKNTLTTINVNYTFRDDWEIINKASKIVHGLLGNSNVDSFYDGEYHATMVFTDKSTNLQNTIVVNIKEKYVKVNQTKYYDTEPFGKLLYDIFDKYRDVLKNTNSDGIAIQFNKFY